MPPRTLLVFVFLLALAPDPANADIYSWIDAKGVIHYSTTPPKKTAKKKRVKVHKGQPQSGFVYMPGPNSVTLEPSRTPASAAAAPTAAFPFVELFATGTCGYCAQARSFLQANKVPFTELDVENNEAAYTRWRGYGGRGVPLALIGGSPVSGFSSELYRQKLGLP